MEICFTRIEDSCSPREPALSNICQPRASCRHLFDLGGGTSTGRTTGHPEETPLLSPTSLRWALETRLSV